MKATTMLPKSSVIFNGKKCLLTTICDEVKIYTTVCDKEGAPLEDGNITIHDTLLMAVRFHLASVRELKVWAADE